MSGRRIVLAAHGSADPRYPAVIEAIAESVRRELRARSAMDAADVVIGYLDHCEPRLADVARPDDLVVPLLLSAGYHAAVDIPAVVGPDCLVTPTLGPDPRLARACADRLREAGWNRSDPRRVVLAAAGSSDPQASRDVAVVADQLAGEIGREVVPAYLSPASPRLGDVVAGAAAVVTYLIAPGHFADRAAASGAPVVTDVLGSHPLIAQIVADRADANGGGR